MKYRILGNTGLYVSELCLGTMTFGGKGYWAQIGQLQQDDVDTLVKTAFDNGINFIDTANVYSFGESEELTGKSLKKLGIPRDEIIVATKATGVMNDKTNGRGQSRYHLMNELDNSLKRLQLDYIDLYQLHAVDPLTPIEDSLSTLNDMVRSGKVRYIGICNMAAWQIMKAIAISKRRNWERIVSVQAYYTIAGRDLEREVVPMIEDQKLGLMVWSPLAGGLLSGKFKSDGTGPTEARRTKFDFPIIDKEKAFRCIAVMEKIAHKNDVSIAQIALAWLLSRNTVSSVIIGAKNVGQLKDNIGATNVKLSAEDLDQLDHVSKLPQEYPQWMIERQSEYRKDIPQK